MAEAQFHDSHGLEFSLVLSSDNAVADIDLQLVAAEINMYEDMFGSFMRIEVLINDALGILDKFPVIGEETLTFTYNILQKKIYTETFKIYRVSNRSISRARVHTAVLYGISIPGHQNSLQSIYKPYINQRCDDIVFDIYYEYLDPSFGASGKPLQIPVVSENNYTRVSTGQNPLQLINMISNESKSSKSKDYKNPSNYVFYEDNQNFNFVPINFLIEKNQAPKLKKFFLSVPQNKDQFEKGENPYPSQSILSFKFIDQTDQLDSIHRGTYLNEVNIIDPILKRFKMHPITEKTKFQFKYNRDFDDLKHLPNSNKKYITADGDVGKGTKPYAAHRRMMITQYENEGEKYPTIGYLNGKVSAGDQLLNPRQRHKTLPESIHEMGNLFEHVVEITVPGDPDITVGHQVQILVPQPTQFDSETNRFLEMYGQEARFLITALRHVYQADKDAYYMVLSCSAESFGKDVEGMRVI